MDKQTPEGNHTPHELFVKIEREIRHLRITFGIAIVIVAVILTAMVVTLTPGLLSSRFNPYLDQAAMPTFTTVKVDPLNHASSVKSTASSTTASSTP